jgi:spore germination cell wall hydrolase CwlJ-like protein
VTKGATHYHADSITPYWAKGERPSAVIGHHLFYKII